ncbi:Mu-like prophage I protein [compost metagenome]
MIEAGEYRYLSPVFSYDPKTGDVLDLHHVGLTNYPALDGMAALPALAAARFGLAGWKDQDTARATAASDSEVVSLKQEVAALRAAQSESEVEQLVQSGLTAGRLLPAQELWARELGHSSIAALKGYLEKTPVIPTLARCLAQERQDAPTNVDELPPEALAACRGLGISPEDYLATLNA